MREEDETGLEALIAARIAETGPMTIGDYMSLALGHPRFGYYMGRDPFGRGGDFITAPEISQMFGEILGLWALSAWRDLGFSGAPRLIELGAGRGTLMADATRAICKILGADTPIDIDLVEMSPVLREMQRESLARGNFNVRWWGRVEEVPAGPFILLANEFLDCLPLRQWQVREGNWHERLVGLAAQGRLMIGLAPYCAQENETLPSVLEAGEGAVYERSEAACRLMVDMARRVKEGPGVALFLDYGSRAGGFGDTLQAVKDHRYADPLIAPGTADLTVHVDFAALSKAARAAGAVIGGPVGQGEFLLRLGLEARAARLAAGQPAAVQNDIAQGLQRLTGAGQMGELFQAMTLSAPQHPLPPPF